MLSRTKRYLSEHRETDDPDHPIHKHALGFIDLADTIREQAQEDIEDQFHYYGRTPSSDDIEHFQALMSENVVKFLVATLDLNELIRMIASACDSYEDIQKILNEIKEDAEKASKRSFDEDLGDLDDHPF